MTQKFSSWAPQQVPESTPTSAGLMSAADKAKLNTVEEGAQPSSPTDLSYTASSRLLESSTGTDVTLPLFATNSANAGLVPGSSTGGTTNFLRADGTWAAVVGATDLSYTASSRLLESSTGADVTLPLFAINSTNAGLVPGSSTGGTTNFLRADGTWAAPPGGVSLSANLQSSFSASGTTLAAVDPGADRILFWDDSAGLLTHLTLGPGVTIVDTTIYADESICIACSDETTNITVGASKASFVMPYAATLLSVRASANAAPTGSIAIFDVNENGVSVFSTRLSIDANETDSATAATPAVISDSALANGSVITIDFDQVGSVNPGKGVKIWLLLRRAS